MIPLHPNCRCIALPFKGTGGINTVDDANRWIEENELNVKFARNISDSQKIEFTKSLKTTSDLYSEKINIRLGQKISDNFGNKQFGKNWNVINDTNGTKHLGEFIRPSGEEDRFIINYARKNDFDFKGNLYEIGKGETPLFNITSMEDVMIHEVGHNLYFKTLNNQRLLWKRYFEKEGWKIGNTPSYYGQENHGELFAESIVSKLRGRNIGNINKVDEIFEYFNNLNR